MQDRCSHTCASLARILPGYVRRFRGVDGVFSSSSRRGPFPFYSGSWNHHDLPVGELHPGLQTPANSDPAFVFRGVVRNDLLLVGTIPDHSHGHH